MKKEKLSLLPEELEVIYGGLLGDSHLRKGRNEINFAHSINQSEYLHWKWGKLEMISNKIYEIDSNGFKQERFNSFINEKDYRHLYLLTYNHHTGKKTVTRKWLNLLTPLSLAIWWMDDGCLSVCKGNRYGKLCTHSFSYEEHLIIQKYFKTVWNIDIQIKLEKNKYYFCRLNVENLKKLFNIIYPYIFENPNMMYKIDLKYSRDKKSLPPFNL